MASKLLAKYKSSATMDKLVASVDKLSEKAGFQGEDTANHWYPSVDKAGNGYAIVRFLPPPIDEDSAIVRRWTHAFKGPTGQWYIENSRTTLGERDPVSELNSKLWNSGDQDGARKQKRNLEFFTNVYVIRDKEHPENEGKVFVYKFGKRIFDKIEAARKPKFEDEKPLNAFDLFTGASFKIKIANKDGYRNYDESTFDAPSAFLDGDEDAIEAVLGQLHSIAQYVDPAKFKTYEQLKARLDLVMGDAEEQTVSEASEDTPPWDDTEETKKPAKPVSTKKPAKVETSDEDGEEDEILRKLRGQIEGI